MAVATTAARAELQLAWDRRLEGVSGSFGPVLHSAEGPVLDRDPDGRHYAASTIKLVVLAAWLHDRAAGLTNSVTAAGLAVLMAGIADHSLLGQRASTTALDLLARQSHRRMIPAGLPQGTWSASKKVKIKVGLDPADGQRVIDIHRSASMPMRVEPGI